MPESIQLDIIGETHIDFGEEAFVYIKDGYARLRLPTRIAGRAVNASKPITYRDIQWVGSIVRRQWWLLIPGIFFTLFGPVWANEYFGDWGPFTISLLWFVVLGVIPLLLLVKGRPFLSIATTDQITMLPMDRQKEKIGRILGLLRQSCPASSIIWQLDGTPFENPDSWDNRPPTGKRFNRKRYLSILILCGLYGGANLLYSSPRLGLIALAIQIGALAATAIMVIYAMVYKRLKMPRSVRR